MKHPKIVSLLVMLAVFGSVAGVAWAATSLASPEEPNNSMPKLQIQEQVRGAAMAYIASTHPETQQFISDLGSWSGGKVETGLLGAETYEYTSGGWTVTIKYPVIANPTYSITANYVSSGIGIPYSIAWEGTWTNGNIAETSFTFAQ